MRRLGKARENNAIYCFSHDVMKKKLAVAMTFWKNVVITVAITFLGKVAVAVAITKKKCSEQNSAKINIY